MKYLMRAWAFVFMVGALMQSALATEAMVGILRQTFPQAEVSEVSTTNYLVRLGADCGPVALSGTIGGLTLDLNGHSITGKSDMATMEDGTALMFATYTRLSISIIGPGEIVGGDGAPQKPGGYGIYNRYTGSQSYSVILTIGADVLVCGGRGGDNLAGTGGAGGHGLYLTDRYSKVFNYGTLKGGKGGFGVPYGGTGGASGANTYAYINNYGLMLSGEGGDGTVPGWTRGHGATTEARGTVVNGPYGTNTCVYALRDQLGATLSVLSTTNYVLTLDDDVAGPIYIPDSMGMLTIDLNGHSITGLPSQAELVAGSGIVLTGGHALAGVETQLIIKGPGSVVGGTGAPGAPGAPGIYVATLSPNGWKSILIDEDVTVLGGAGGDNPAGDGGAGGAGIYSYSSKASEETLRYQSLLDLTNAGTIIGGAGGAGSTGGGNGGTGVYRTGICLTINSARYGGRSSVFSNLGTVKGGNGGIGGNGAEKPGAGGAGVRLMGVSDKNSGTIALGEPGFCDLALVDNFYSNLVTVVNASTEAGDPRDQVTLSMVGWAVSASNAQGRATSVQTASGGTVGATNGVARLSMGVVGTGVLSIGDIVRRPADDGGDVAALCVRVDGEEVRRFAEESVVSANGLREQNVEVVVSGDGNRNHLVELVYAQTMTGGVARSSCALGGISWRSYRQMDDGGTTWLDAAEAAPVVIVDHEQASPNVTHLAFEPKLKVPGELEYWIRRSAEKDANGRSRICVKLGRTRRECTDATPIDAELRDFGEDIPKGARDLDKGIVWLTVTLPENVVQPVGYWRVYLRPSQMDFAPEHAQRAMGPTSFRVHYLEVGTCAVLAEPRTFTNQKVGALVHIPWYAVDVGNGYTLQNDPDECALLALDPVRNEYVCWYDHPAITSYSVRYMYEDLTFDIFSPRNVVDQPIGKKTISERASSTDAYGVNSSVGRLRSLSWNEELNVIIFTYYMYL